MSQGRESAWIRWSEAGKRRWCWGRGRQKVSVTVTESDTKLRPKLIACLLISPANDRHSLSQNGRERNPYSSVFNFHFLNNDPNKVFKYGGEQSDPLCDNHFKMTYELQRPALVTRLGLV